VPAAAERRPSGPVTDGERWARDALGELREAGYPPRAWARFLRASHRRSRAVHAARPALVRQARTWMALGTAAWVAPAMLGIQPFRRRLVPGLRGWAITSLMLEWHLGMLETEDGRPRALGPADACTLARAWLVPLAADRPTTLVCAAGFASDGLDGMLARAGIPTRAGRDLEGVVDAAFSVAAVRGGVRQGWLPAPAAAAELGRLTLGAAVGSVLYFRGAARPDPRITHAGRAFTPLRAAGLLAASRGWRRAAGAFVTMAAASGAAAVVEAAASSRPSGTQLAGAKSAAPLFDSAGARPM